MAEIVFQKLPNGTLMPADQDGIDYLSRKKIGAGFRNDLDNCIIQIMGFA